MSKENASRGADRPVYHWLDHELVVKKEKTVKNISGRNVALVVEVRRPENTFDLKLRLGRPSHTTVDGITKSLWLEDIPELMVLVSEAMEEAIPHYERLKKEQMESRVAMETEALERQIRDDPSDWRNKLADLKF